MTQTQKQDALLPAVTRVDDAARMCAAGLDALDDGTARLRGVDTSDLDTAARLVAECRKKLQQAHTLIVGVALAK